MPQPSPTHGSAMDLGALSISLDVKDLATSRAFYETLGFEAAGGDPAQNWLIMRNGLHVIGLFQGMLQGNAMTFNPGWNQAAEAVDDFTDVRDIQASLKAAGTPLMVEADPDSTGVAHIVLQDPDGNSILIDQHVPKPTK